MRVKIAPHSVDIPAMIRSQKTIEFREKPLLIVALTGNDREMLLCHAYLTMIAKANKTPVTHFIVFSLLGAWQRSKRWPIEAHIDRRWDANPEKDLVQFKLFHPICRVRTIIGGKTTSGLRIIRARKSVGRVTAPV